MAVTWNRTVRDGQVWYIPAPRPPSGDFGWIVIILVVFVLMLAPGCTPNVEPYPYRAIDGDTIAVGNEAQHIRLLHIDAPELPGHCVGFRAEHHSCAAGDPFASQEHLQELLDSARGRLVCVDKGVDVYGRRLSSCRVGALDLSQAMLDAGMAEPYYYQGVRQ